MGASELLIMASITCLASRGPLRVTHCHRATCHPLFRDVGLWLQQLGSS